MIAVLLRMAEKTHIPLPSAKQDDFAALLFRVANARDRAAFAMIFDHFAPRVKSFMMRKGASAEVAEDLVQETMIAVWSKAALYVPERGAASTWVFTIARNLRIDRLRRESSAYFTDLEDFDAPSDDVPGDEALNRQPGRQPGSQGLGANSARTARATDPFLRGRRTTEYDCRTIEPAPWHREVPHAPRLQAHAQAFGGGELTIVHHLDDATILSYAAGTLGEALSVAAACHISMCAECRTAVRKAEALGGEILDDLEATAVSDVRRAATLASLDDARAAKPAVVKSDMPAPLQRLLQRPGLRPIALAEKSARCFRL